MDNLTEVAKQQLKNINGFIANNNYNVIKVEKYYCELEGILTETSMNHLKTAHGGYIFGLADTAAGIAAISDGRNAVTVDSNINYFKPATGEKLIAIAKVLKPGKAISVFEVLIYDNRDDLVAKATITYYYIEK